MLSMKRSMDLFKRTIVIVLCFLLLVPGSSFSQFEVRAAEDETVKKFDFGTSDSEVADEYEQVTAEAAYSEELGYGFVDVSKVEAVNRGTGDALHADFIQTTESAFVVDLPHGDYEVIVTAGDSEEAIEVGVKVEGIQKIENTSTTVGQHLERDFEIALVDEQLTIEFTGESPKINGLVIKELPVRTAGDKPTVYISGDSTVQTYDPYWQPQAGWGQMLDHFFTTDVEFKNHAIGGRSTKSFIFQGRLDNVLRELQPNDYFLIQFGHNDATISIPDRYASVPDYKEYLKIFVTGARQRGATPILITPVGRRDFNPSTGEFNVSFPEYVQGMKEVADELNVDLVDLSASSVDYYNSIGPEGTLSVFLHVPAGVYQAHPDGKEDNTHFQEYGAIQLARLVSQGIADLSLPLSSLVSDIEEPEEVPAKPSGVVASNISNAGALLTWDAMDGADIYKVYRKQVTEDEYSLIGTSTIPRHSMIGMEDGQTYHVVVSAVNGKGESEWSDVVEIETKEATMKYDFGLAGNPVAEGYTEVNLLTVYSEERGYGIVDPNGMIGRDRGTGGDLLRDWLGYFSVGWRFNVDLPNGLYAVKVYVGDFLGSARTNLFIEGQDFGAVNAANRNYTEKVVPEVAITDGQMNFYFGGSTGIVNGLEITPILLAPSELTATDISFNPPSVSLSWTGAEEATNYHIYRKTPGMTNSKLIESINETSFIDTTVELGMDYEYTVTTVDAANTESVPSVPLQVSMVDSDVEIPGIPNYLQLGDVNKNDLTFSWDEVDTALSYNIYRAKNEDGNYDLIGHSKEPTFTDETVLTTVSYYYKVATVNAGGVSGLSDSLETPIVTQLSRQMESLSRDPYAIQTDNGVYVSWRMLGTDTYDIGFNVYRNKKKLNKSPIKTSTNYIDKKGKLNATYEIRTVINGKEQDIGEKTKVRSENFLDIPLQKPAPGETPTGETYDYRANDTSIGDLDGDGNYEYIVKWDPSNSKDNSQSGYTGNVYIDAYKLDGTLLWRIDLGKNTRAGAHYTQFLVYDFDGNGKAEVVFKTADGTIDGLGNVIGRADADHRNSGGYVLQGDEYLTIFDGETGEALSTVDYDPPRGDVGSWGDGYGNRVDRFLASVAYLDGEHPSIIMARGAYTRTVLVAYDWQDGELTKRWTFDTNQEEYRDFAGQGYHSLSIADVDGDQKDEIIYGAMVVDDDGTGLYSTGLGHGDALHVGDFLPNREGLEIFAVQEDVNAEYGYNLRDAKTGEVIWGVATGEDTGRGLIADIDPRYDGAESWAVAGAWNSRVGGLHAASGEQISENIPAANFAIWWDGDVLREILDHNWNQDAGVGIGTIDKWDYENEQMINLLTAEGTFSNNYTKGTPALQADLFGDWREEVIWRTEDSEALRIYFTTAETDTKIHTLMHDPQYRLAIAWQNVSYNQPPHPSFFIGHEMEQPSLPHIHVIGGNSEDEPDDGKKKPGKKDKKDKN